MAEENTDAEENPNAPVAADGEQGQDNPIEGQEGTEEGQEATEEGQEGTEEGAAAKAPAEEDDDAEAPLSLSHQECTVTVSFFATDSC